MGCAGPISFHTFRPRRTPCSQLAATKPPSTLHSLPHFAHTLGPLSHCCRLYRIVVGSCDGKRRLTRFWMRFCGASRVERRPTSVNRTLSRKEAIGGRRVNLPNGNGSQFSREVLGDWRGYPRLRLLSIPLSQSFGRVTQDATGRVAPANL